MSVSVLVENATLLWESEPPPRPVVIAAKIERASSSVAADGSDVALLPPKHDSSADGSSSDVLFPRLTPKQTFRNVLLSNVNVKVATGTLCAVVGPTGSGKSGLLKALIGDLAPHKGRVGVKGSIAYAAQTAWIQNGTANSLRPLNPPPLTTVTRNP